MKPIGVIHSPYKEKFSIPRQPLLAQIEMELELFAPYNRKEALVGLEEFSHLWIQFLFHAINEDDEKLSVRPPRLGGNQKQGVFATRSPYRPNRLGLSVVKLKAIEYGKIIILGGDFLDQTPILDIKPYLREIDSIVDAKSSWVDQKEDRLLNVTFLEHVLLELKAHEEKSIRAILSLDPRPRFHDDQFKTYASKLFSYDLYWKVEENNLIVFDIKIL
jgi:tRNA-Thr(GGU) m(6)t(6)A37 methyltransferase TsaA